MTRYTPMPAPLLIVGVLSALFLLTAGCTNDRGHPDWGSWQLVAEIDGQASIRDYDLSQSDCEFVADVLIATEPQLDVIYCEDVTYSEAEG